MMGDHNKTILMVSAENDALPGAKVGGVGDVMRDLPAALMREGADVESVIPSYGFLARLPNLLHIKTITIKFGRKSYQVDVLKLAGEPGRCGCYIIHHPEFSKKGESVYYNDDDHRPFASDATKFAFFCRCVVEALLQGAIRRPQILHCHDWHTAFILMLLKYGTEYVALRNITTVFTIHNLAMQGIRPFSGDESSFNAWFPDLRYSIDKVIDPRYRDCINPMRAGILLADRVHTVSPSYAKEILHESHYELGIYGGDGLENDLCERTDKKQVFGILNGCEYPAGLNQAALPKHEVAELMRSSIERWALRSQYLSTAHWFAEKGIAHWESGGEDTINITSVGRLVEQKVRVLHTPISDGRTALEAILDLLDGNGTMIMLGNGSAHLESYFAEMAARHHNLIFLNGYSDELSRELYRFGDLFLMPSSFEPCGISQMLAMRAGQPCLVNGVGGLRDTVTHMETGFVFSGRTAVEQAEALVQTFAQAVTLFRTDKAQWRRIKEAAAAKRFTWEDAADQYLDVLYS